MKFQSEQVFSLKRYPTRVALTSRCPKTQRVVKLFNSVETSRHIRLICPYKCEMCDSRKTNGYKASSAIYRSSYWATGTVPIQVQRYFCHMTFVKTIDTGGKQCSGKANIHKPEESVVLSLATD